MQDKVCAGFPGNGEAMYNDREYLGNSSLLNMSKT